MDRVKNCQNRKKDMYKSFYTILTNLEANLGELDCLRHELLPKGRSEEAKSRKEWPTTDEL